MTGLLGAATLFGILIGAPVFGRFTDRYGRRTLMIVDLAVFVVASLVQIVVSDVWQLIALRFVLGVAIGADYPIAGALIAESSPARLRGAAVNTMQVAWFLGAAVAYVAGYALLATGSESGNGSLQALRSLRVSGSCCARARPKRRCGSRRSAPARSDAPHSQPFSDRNTSGD